MKRMYQFDDENEEIININAGAYTMESLKHFLRIQGKNNIKVPGPALDSTKGEDHEDSI